MGKVSTSITCKSTENQVNYPLRIWWDKGFNPQEDEALIQLVDDWEQKNPQPIQLSFYTSDELSQKVQRAIKAEDPPDIIMNFKSERSLNSRLAWEGKLVDVSDVITPAAQNYEQAILDGVKYYNNQTKERSYYAVPINQATVHIYYWRDMLSNLGYTDADIPQDWDNFWNFWKKVHEQLQAKNLDVDGIGFPMSIEAADTHLTFEQILEAYDVQVLKPQGGINVDAPQVRQGIIKCLDWYSQFYRQSYVPKEAIKWLNPDNNRSFLNRSIVMTPNYTLSIPGALRQEPDTYLNKLGMVEFPNKPSGEPMRSLVTVEQAIIFADSKNQKAARSFLAYMIQPEVMAEYLKNAGGRNAPVVKQVWNEPFWHNQQDPHILTATKTLTQGKTRLFYIAQNPAYSLVLKENVWGRALQDIVLNNSTPEQAAEQAIARIKAIFSEWKSEK
ncbi:MAG: carbohydrate ABC transporter substrate-binding protein [Cyanobacteria bacterium J083]|nr:MAG: carbohydrate ABC transporter substrate-binding protein [Cyanobacteria bacterium J083]